MSNWFKGKFKKTPKKGSVVEEEPPKVDLGVINNNINHQQEINDKKSKNFNSIKNVTKNSPMASEKKNEVENMQSNVKPSDTPTKPIAKSNTLQDKNKGSNRDIFENIHKSTDSPRKRRDTMTHTVIELNNPLGSKLNTKVKDVIEKRTPLAKRLSKESRYRSKSLEFIEDKDAIERKIEFFRQVLFSKSVYPDLSNKSKLQVKSFYSQLNTQRQNLLETTQQEKTQKDEDNFVKNIEHTKKPKGFGPWEILWEFKEKDIRKESPYSNFQSYKIRPIIIKGGDDLRQEIIAMQIIKKFKEIFTKENTGLHVRPYEII